MDRFRKRPVEVSAHRWFKNGDHPADDCFRPFEDTGEIPSVPREGAVVRFFRHPEAPGLALCRQCERTMHEHGWIDTLEGGHIVCPGDWIICGVKGEFYPCKPDIFSATYESVDAPFPARRFPMIGGPWITWAVAEEIYRVYCELYGDALSLEDIATRRSGFSWPEVHTLNREYRRKFGRTPDGWTRAT